MCLCRLFANSPRSEPNMFFESSLTQAYEYQNIGHFFICTDCNGRCGDALEFIPGVDPK